MDADVVVIGAGVVGLATARELLAHGLSVLVVDKEHDVGRGASGRNSGVVHSGFAVPPGSLKARLSIEGSRLLRALCAGLDVPLAEVGTLVVAADAGDAASLERLKAAGEANGLDDLEILDGTALAALEPDVEGVAALLSPSGAVVDPLALVARLADAVVQGGSGRGGRCTGGEIRLLAEVTGLASLGRGEGWEVIVGARDAVRTRVVVNAAGVAAPRISAMAGGESFESTPCRGEYLVLDKQAVGLPTRMVYPVPPTSGGLGVHFTPTVHGTTLVGPSAEYVDEAQGESTSSGVLQRLTEEARGLCRAFDPDTIITSFAGVRAKIGRGAYGQADFVIEESGRAPGLVNLVGIESPGLTAAPAIALTAAGLALRSFPGAERSELPEPPPRSPRFAELDDAGRAAWAARDPDAREIVCRCEQVTRAEVVQALGRGPGGLSSLAGVRARCRAGSGRCQGGFCGPKVTSILREELGSAPARVTLKGPGSELFAGEAKELLR